MNKSSILVIDDNPEICSLIEKTLEQNGYAVFKAASGIEAQHILRVKKVVTILLDLQLPDGDGLALIANIRKLSTAPIIVISGKGSTIDKVVGLEMGADDYIAKPFDLHELSARVKASLRRYMNAQSPSEESAATPNKVRFAGFILDASKFEVFAADGKSCGLTTMEFQLLQVLVNAPNRALSRVQILDAVRADNPHISDRAIDIQITRIRKKLGVNAKDSQIIKTIRNIGYMLACDTEIIEG